MTNIDPNYNQQQFPVNAPYVPQSPDYWVAQPPKRRKWPIIVGAIVVAVFAACGLGVLALGGAAKEVHNQTVQQTNDIKMTSCKADEFGMVDVTYTITNSASVSETYVPHFQFQDASGAVIGDAYDISSSVAPGKVYKGKTTGTISGDLKTCSVVGA